MNKMVVELVILLIIIIVIAGFIFWIGSGGAPQGGTIFDSNVSPVKFVGHVRKPATKVMTAKTCAQEYTGYGWSGWDSYGDSCYTCPRGFNRTWDHISTSTACAKSHFGEKSHATKRRLGLGPAGLTRNPGGAFLDLSAYWKCPANTRRTASHVTANDACIGACTDMYPGSFEHLTTGKCYKCPTGLNRSAALIEATNACSN